MIESKLDGYVEELYKSIKKREVDKNALIEVTVQNPLKERLKIKEKYKATYGQDLLDDFKSNLSGDFLDLMLALYTDIYEYDSQQCHKAIEGLGTNEDTLIEIIGTRPSWMLKIIKEEYKKNYKIDLENDVIDDTSGFFKNLLVCLLQCNRNENKNPDIEKCKKIVEELYNSEKKKLVTDEKIIINYFGNCSGSELMTIAREYHRESGNSLMKDIEKGFSGDIRKLIQTIIFANISPSEYFATRINEAIKGFGTNAKILTRVVVTRNEIDMNIIKEYYKLLFNKNLIDDIKSDTSGEYRKLLILLINK